MSYKVLLLLRSAVYFEVLRMPDVSPTCVRCVFDYCCCCMIGRVVVVF